MRSDVVSFGQPSSEFEDPAHARVSKVDILAVHHRAGTSDHADFVLTAILDGLRRDTRSLPYRLVHPHAANAGIVTVVDDPLRDVRSGDDHHAIDGARD